MFIKSISMTANHIELEKKYKHANINIERGGEGEGEREMQKKRQNISIRLQTTPWGWAKLIFQQREMPAISNKNRINSNWISLEHSGISKIFTLSQNYNKS